MPGSPEVGAHAGDRCVGVHSAELELDVVVELLEAFLAGDLGPAGPRSRLRSRARLSWSSTHGVNPVGSSSSSSNRRPSPREVCAKLLAGVVDRLVKRTAGCVQTLGEDVDRDVVERDGDQNLALMRR